MQTKFFKKFLFAFAIFASLLIGNFAHADSGASLWKLVSGILQPINTTWSLKIPQLGGAGTKCLHTDNAGLISVTASDCGSGGGGTPAGSNNEIQINNAGSFGAISLGSANTLLGMNTGGTANEYKTISNGLTSSSGALKLGGNLTGDTTIDGASTYSLSETNLLNYILSASSAQILGASTEMTGIGAATLQSVGSLRIKTPGVVAGTSTVGQYLKLNNATTGDSEWATISGSGTVTSVSVATANGFAGSVANATTTPAITLSTTITGLLKGNGTAISAASAGTDYENPLTFSTGLTRSTNTITSNLSTGIAGGQSVIGGTASGENLTLTSTSNATKGNVIFAARHFFDQVNNYLGLGITPVAKLHVSDSSSNANRGIVNDQYSTDTGSSRIISRKARGGSTSATTVVTGDNLASWMIQGYDGTSFVDSARILTASTGTIGTGIVPSIMSLQTANSSGTLTTGLSINSAQAVTMPAYTTNGGLLYTNGSGLIQQSAAITGIVKGNGTSAPSQATAGTDYVAPGAVTSNGITMTTARMLGRTTASTGAVEEITVGSGLTLASTSLTTSSAVDKKLADRYVGATTSGSSEEMTYSLLIPAGTIGANDALYVKSNSTTNSATGNAIRYYFNTSASLSGATQWAQGGNPTNQIAMVLVRTIRNTGATNTNSVNVPVTTGLQSDETGYTNNSYTTLSIDFSVDQYLVISTAGGSSNSTLRNVEVVLKKQI